MENLHLPLNKLLLNPKPNQLKLRRSLNKKLKLQRNIMKYQSIFGITSRLTDMVMATDMAPVKKESKKFKFFLFIRSAFKQTAFSAAFLIIFFVIIGLGLADTPSLVNRLFIFILAIIIGYMVIWNVTPALHTPLMSVTNAISGVIVVGCMLEINENLTGGMNICGTIGVFFASINIYGGFIVTDKMLKMFLSH